MYVEEIRDRDEFIKTVEQHRRTVRVSERCVAWPDRRQGVDVVDPVLERHYSMIVDDDRRGQMRFIFTEYLVAGERTFPYETSIINELYKRHVDVLPNNRITGPSAAA